MQILKYPYITLLITTVLCLCSCHTRRDSAAVTEGVATLPDSASRIVPRHAHGFAVDYIPDGVTLLTVTDPSEPGTRNYRFALIPEGSDAAVPDGYERLQIPVRRVVCMTSLQLSNFIRLGLTDRVVGVTSTRHLHNAEMRQRLDENKTARIGIEGNFDAETVMALTPDMVFVSPFKRGGYDALRGTDAPLLPHLGYKECTPLGQAEWIKVVGLLTGCEKRANEVFDSIEARYDSLRSLAAGIDPRHRPTVFSGEIRGGNWYAVGGRSFLAELFRDAGAEYFLNHDNSSGGVTLDFETVYGNAVHTDYWRIVNSFDGEYSYQALADSDSRYTYFDAWRNGKVIYCNMTQTPYYEQMPVEPDVVLADLIKVFHPNLLPQHTPVYYKLLPR